MTNGSKHSCAIQSGKAYCWGANNQGQLGDGTNIDRNTAAEVKDLPYPIVEISAGGDHTCALRSSGEVFCWGDNSSGQLGDGTTNSNTLPVQVSGLAMPVTHIAAGDMHTCAIIGGTVQCWGANSFGQLGDGTSIQRNTPVATINLPNDVLRIAAGWAFTCGLHNTNSVNCWGSNWKGQLGSEGIYNSTTPISVAGLNTGFPPIVAGDNHTCVLTTNGGILCWGDNAFGQLGNGTTIQENSPVSVLNVDNAVFLAAGGWHTCLLTSNWGVKCWGWNVGGRLGDGTQTDRSIPVDVVGLSSGVYSVAVGDSHTCAALQNSVKCWGENNYGQLGNGTNLNSSIPTTVIGIGTP